MFRFYNIAVFLIIPLLISCSGANNNKLNQQLLAEGKNEEALKNYKEEVLANPQNNEYRYLLANAHYRNNDLDTSLKEVQVAIAGDPFIAKYHFLAGKIYYDKQLYFEAIRELSNSLKLDNRLLEGYHLLALSLNKVGKDSDAIEQLETAISLEDLYFDAHLALVKIKYKSIEKQADLINLIDRLKNSLLIEPESIEGNLFLARMTAKNAQTFKAKVIIENWLKRNGDNDRMFLELAKIQLKIGNLKEAETSISRLKIETLAAKILKIKLKILQRDTTNLVPVIQQLIMDNPQSSDLLILQGQLKMLQGKNIRAELDFRKAVLLNPNSAEAHYNMSRILTEDFDFYGAKIEIEKSLAIDKTNLKYNLHLFYILIQDGKGYLVPSLLEQLKPDKNNVEIKRIYAALAEENGNWEEAFKLYNATVDANYFDTSLQNRLATIEIKLKMYYSAENRLKKILLVDPDNLTAALNKARLYYQLKQYNKIPAILEKHLTNIDGKGRIHYLLAEAYVSLNKISKALEIFSDGLDRWNRNPNLAQVYSFHLANQKKYEQAIEVLLASQEYKHRLNSQFNLSIARYYYSLGNKAKYLEYLNKYNLKVF